MINDGSPNRLPLGIALPSGQEKTRLPMVARVNDLIAFCRWERPNLLPTAIAQGFDIAKLGAL